MVRTTFVAILWLAIADVACSQTLPVFTEFSPPYQYTDEDNRIIGLSTQRVETIFELAQLTPDFYLFPWARSLHLAQTTPSALIYSIARTPETNESPYNLKQIQ